MGCAGSKLEDLEAVTLCKGRVQLLSEAIGYRYALADAHDAYIHSLRSVGLSLNRFFLATDGVASSSFPVLTLPQQRKGDPIPPPTPSPLPPPPVVLPSTTPAVTHHHSRSNSGSHIQFHSSDEDDDDGHLHSDHSSPLHSDHDDDLDIDPIKQTTTTYFNFAKKGPPASSVTYEQPRFTSNTASVHQGGVFGAEPSSSSAYPYYYPDSYANANQNFYGVGDSGGSAYPYPYPYPDPQAYGGMGGGFFGSSFPPAPAAPPPAAPSSSRPLPPPPSPPRASNWDFLNPFDLYDNYYNKENSTPSRSSKELREEEGIPDLEDEEQEVVKEAYGDEKPAASMAASSSAANTFSKGVGMEEDGRRSVGEETHYQPRTSGAGVGDVPVMDKNIVGDEVQQHSEEAMRRKVVPGSRPVPDVVQEVRSHFDRASQSCENVSRMLEVGKHRYHRRKYEVVSTRMMYAITPSLSKAASSQTSTSKDGTKSENVSSVYFELDEEKGMRAGNLSSTLQKLYIWEKKLLDEVKAEEDMRIQHERKCKRLKRLDEKGAETYKIDSTRTLVKKLSTKIRIALEVVNSISNRINKLRDEELLPQLNEFILGLVVMWQITTQCLRCQCEAVIEAQNLDAVAEDFTLKASDDHMDATMQLGLEMLNWIETFSSWTGAQRCFVKALNGWLIKCLHYEPEETADGIVPFSPGRLGAPSVFVICNTWSQVIDRFSESEVIDAMKSFATNVLHVWQHHCSSRRRRMRANQDMDRRLKALDRDEQKLHKAVEAVNKRQAQVSDQSGLPSTAEIILVRRPADLEKVANLQSDLQHIFEAMERYAENSMKAYEELRLLCEEERAGRENTRIS